MSANKPSKVHLSIEAEDPAEVARISGRFDAAWNSSGSGAPPVHMGHSTLIVGDRALLAIGVVVFIALLLHTAFWSFVLPYGALVS